jgi:hypothetical protein
MDSSEASKLVAARISQLELDAAGEKDQEAEIGASSFLFHLALVYWDQSRRCTASGPLMRGLQGCDGNSVSKASAAAYCCLEVYTMLSPA